MFDLRDIAGSLGLFSGEGQIMAEYALNDGTTEPLFAKTVEHGAYEGVRSRGYRDLLYER